MNNFGDCFDFDQNEKKNSQALSNIKIITWSEQSIKIYCEISWIATCIVLCLYCINSMCLAVNVAVNSDSVAVPCRKVVVALRALYTNWTRIDSSCVKFAFFSTMASPQYTRTKCVEQMNSVGLCCHIYRHTRTALHSHHRVAIRYVLNASNSARMVPVVLFQWITIYMKMNVYNACSMLWMGMKIGMLDGWEEKDREWV